MTEYKLVVVGGNFKFSFALFITGTERVISTDFRLCVNIFILPSIYNCKLAFLFQLVALERVP